MNINIAAVAELRTHTTDGPCTTPHCYCTHNTEDQS